MRSALDKPRPPSLASCTLSSQGQRPCDLADEEVLSLLEELAQKQEDVSPGASSLLLLDGRLLITLPMAGPFVKLGSGRRRAWGQTRFG